MEFYEKLKEIGKGSYGVVWLVKNRKDRKNYVMKQIDLRKTSDKDIQSAQQEAKLLSKLKHPNIVAYRDSFQTNGYLYIVMLYCEGGDLYTKIKEQNNRFLDEIQVVEWFVQIAMALQYMHERHILHRDLKTQNIFLTKNKIVKVGDLGIARVLKGNNDMATTVIGTPYYMSPELFSNKPYNSKSDVWALGCCVYEMATLKHAFNAKDMNSLVYKILRGKMPAVPTVYSKELIQLIESMLNADAKKRPSVNKILRDSYIRHNINLFLERTKQRQKQSSPESRASVHEVSSSPQNNIAKKPYRFSSPDIFGTPSGNNDESSSQQQAQSRQQQPQRQSSLTREINNLLFNSDSEPDQYHNGRQRSDKTSPSANNRRMQSPPKSPSVERQQLHQQPRPRRSVRISSIVDDIETQQQIEINDHRRSSFNETPQQQPYYQPAQRNPSPVADAKFEHNHQKHPNRVNGGVGAQSKSSSASASSSIESIENKEHALANEVQPPKIISNKPINSHNSPVISEKAENRQNMDNQSSYELLGKVNKSARERRRIKLRLSAQSESSSSIDAKPPLLKKVEKLSRPMSGNGFSEVDCGYARPKSASAVGGVSKSQNNADQLNSDKNNEFPFKDSLKLIRNSNQNNQNKNGLDGNQRVVHSKSMPDVPHKTPPAPIPIAARKFVDVQKSKAQFTCGSSSSSTDLDEDLDPEKVKLKEHQKDMKEVANLVTLLNTTLHTLNNYVKQHNGDGSEIDEFEEQLDDIEEIDQVDSSQDLAVRQKQKPTVTNDDFHHELKALETMNNTTLGATKRMQDRIVALEKDCINAIGRTKYQQAYEILECFRDEEVEPKLLELLGRENFNNFAGKIWQLKFYKEAGRLSHR